MASGLLLAWWVTNRPSRLIIPSQKCPVSIQWQWQCPLPFVIILCLQAAGVYVWVCLHLHTEKLVYESVCFPNYPPGSKQELRCGWVLHNRVNKKVALIKSFLCWLYGMNFWARWALGCKALMFSSVASTALIFAFTDEAHRAFFWCPKRNKSGHRFSQILK